MEIFLWMHDVELGCILTKFRSVILPPSNRQQFIFKFICIFFWRIFVRLGQIMKDELTKKKFFLVKKVNLSLSQRLQQARQQKGWTQKELAVVSSRIKYDRCNLVH